MPDMLGYDSQNPDSPGFEFPDSGGAGGSPPSVIEKYSWPYMAMNAHGQPCLMAMPYRTPGILNNPTFWISRDAGKTYVPTLIGTIEYIANTTVPNGGLVCDPHSGAMLLCAPFGYTGQTRSFPHFYAIGDGSDPSAWTMRNCVSPTINGFSIGPAGTIVQNPNNPKSLLFVNGRWNSSDFGYSADYHSAFPNIVNAVTGQPLIANFQACTYQDGMLFATGFDILTTNTRTYVSRDAGWRWTPRDVLDGVGVPMGRSTRLTLWVLGNPTPNATYTLTYAGVGGGLATLSAISTPAEIQAAIRTAGATGATATANPNGSITLAMPTTPPFSQWLTVDDKHFTGGSVQAVSTQGFGFLGGAVVHRHGQIYAQGGATLGIAGTINAQAILRTGDLGLTWEVMPYTPVGLVGPYGPTLGNNPGAAIGPLFMMRSGRLLWGMTHFSDDGAINWQPVSAM